MIRTQRWAPIAHALLVGLGAGAAYLEAAVLPSAERAAIVVAAVVALSRGLGWLFGSSPARARRRRPLREEIADVRQEAKMIGAQLHNLTSQVTTLLMELELIEERLESERDER